jgi:hypothetical protein
MVDEWDSFIFYKLTQQSAHELQYFKFGITQKRHYDIHYIIIRVVAFHTHKLHQSSWIMAQGLMEGILFSKNLSGQFGHKIYVNTSGMVGAQILHLPLGDDSSPRGR